MKKIERLGEYISEYSVRNKDNEDIQVYSVTNTNGFCTEYFDKRFIRALGCISRIRFISIIL